MNTMPVVRLVSSIKFMGVKMQVLTILQEALQDAVEFYHIQVNANLDYKYNYTPMEQAIMVIESYNLPRDVEQYAINKLKKELV